MKKVFVLFVNFIRLLEVLSIIGTAICHLLLKKSSGSNIFYTHLIGLLSFTYVVWLLSALNFIQYTFPFILTILIILVLVSIVYLYKNIEDLKQYIKKNLDTISFSRLIFIGCFIIYILLRSQSPDIYWGEKPMDYGILNNLIGTNQIPPDEIWFSGHTLNYYYYGHFMFATLAKLTFIPSQFVYNLAIATIASLTMLAACGIIFLFTKNYLFSLLSGIFTVFWANLSGIREFVWGKYPIGGFDFYWATSRVIPSTVNEYPIWGLMFGDLHGHILVMPLLILIIYLCSCLFKNIIKENTLQWQTCLLISFVLGTIPATNTWDTPGATAILLICVITALLCNIKTTSEEKTVVDTAKSFLLLISTVLTSFIWFMPFWLTLKRTSDLSIGLVSKAEAVVINDYLFIWGFFLFIFASYFILEILKTNRKLLVETAIILWTFIIITVLLLLFLDYKTIIFTTSILILGITSYFLVKNPGKKLITGLITFGIALTLFAQVIYIYDHMNTIFKFFLEAWYLYVICASYLIYYFFKLYFKYFNKRFKPYSMIIASLWGILFSALVLLSLFTLYTAVTGFSSSHHVKAYKPVNTINGLSYLKYQDPKEYAAIEWIRKNIKLPAIILEAQRADNSAYGDYARIVMNTGIPTVVGWEHHLTQRAIPREGIHKRYDDIKTIYSTQDAETAYNLLKNYNVNYVYAGWLEINTYGLKGVKKFESNPDKFKLIYSNPDVKIFEVL